MAHFQYIDGDTVNDFPSGSSVALAAGDPPCRGFVSSAAAQLLGN